MIHTHAHDNLSGDMKLKIALHALMSYHAALVSAKTAVDRRCLSSFSRNWLEASRPNCGFQCLIKNQFERKISISWGNSREVQENLGGVCEVRT